MPVVAGPGPTPESPVGGQRGDGSVEVVLGNRALAAIALAVLALFGIWFAVGYAAGRFSTGSSPPSPAPEQVSPSPPETAAEPVDALESFQLI
jgi:hypothetical protein